MCAPVRPQIDEVAHQRRELKRRSSATEIELATAAAGAPLTPPLARGVAWAEETAGGDDADRAEAEGARGARNGPPVPRPSRRTHGALTGWHWGAIEWRQRELGERVMPMV